MTRKKVLALLTVAALSLGLVACGGGTQPSEEPAATEEAAPEAESAEAPAETEEAAPEPEAEAEATQAEGGRKFGYTYWAASDFFTTIGESMQEVAQANGDEVLIVDAQQDQAKQISIIEDFITQGVSAVFLNPVDREGVKPALQMLKEAGIPVINVDTSVADLDMVESYIASDNYGAGVLCAEELIKRCPDGGEIAILDYPANSAILDRVAGFTDTIEGKNFTIVAQQDAEGKPEPGLAKTNDILQANPNIVAIFGGNDQCGMGAYAAVIEANSDAIVLGVDGAPESKVEIAKDSAFVATAAQSPKKIGVNSIETAYKVLNGESFEKEILVPTFLIDITNVNDYMDGWQ